VFVLYQWFCLTILNFVRVYTVINYKCPAVAEMDDRFATIDMGCSLPTQAALHASVNPEAYLGWGCYASFRGGDGSPFNTMWPGPRPTSIPSGIPIHPTILPQYSNVTDRTDNGMSVVAKWLRGLSCHLVSR